MKTVEELIEMAKKYEMSEEDKEQQRISFAYGNLKLHDPQVTKDDVESAAKRIKEESQ